MATNPEGGGILFASLPSAGLINPLLAIAGELNRSGVEDIWFASTDERKADIEAIPGQGVVRFVSLGAFRADLWPEYWDDETYEQFTTGSRLRRFATVLAKYGDADHDELMYHRMLEQIDRIRPSIAVIDSRASWAIDAAAVRGVPYILNITVPVSCDFADRLPWSYPTPMSGLPRRMTLRQKIANVLFRLGSRGVAFSPAVIRANVPVLRKRKKAGLPNPEGIPSRYADRAVAIIGCSVFGLEYPFDAAPDHLHMLGAMVPPEFGSAEDDNGLGEWLARHESIVYIGFGTFMRPSRGQIEAIVDVSRRLGPEHHVLWKLPERQQRFLPPRSELPANLRIEQWVPSQLEVLAHPHVRAFFNHGGGNAIHEGLYFGKPLLVMPFWLDCYDFAARAVDSGAALSVEHMETPDPGAILAKLRRLLHEESFRARAREWAERLRAAGGVAAAAKLVLEYRDRNG